METGKGYVFRQLLLVLIVCLISLASLAIGLILKPESWQAIIAKFTGK